MAVWSAAAPRLMRIIFASRKNAPLAARSATSSLFLSVAGITASYIAMAMKLLGDKARIGSNHRGSNALAEIASAAGTNEEQGHFRSSGASARRVASRRFGEAWESIGTSNLALSLCGWPRTVPRTSLVTDAQPRRHARNGAALETKLIVIRHHGTTLAGVAGERNSCLD
jgi:hypothetical protein